VSSKPNIQSKTPSIVTLHTMWQYNCVMYLYTWIKYNLLSTSCQETGFEVAESAAVEICWNLTLESKGKLMEVCGICVSLKWSLIWTKFKALFFDFVHHLSFLYKISVQMEEIWRYLYSVGLIARDRELPRISHIHRDKAIILSHDWVTLDMYQQITTTVSLRYTLQRSL
jgi:hypothetical protein